MRKGNKALQLAAKAKNDEFYTQLEDIENELVHYKKYFKDKVVLCNCDNPHESNFFKYFAMNFDALGLKKLIATCYSGGAIAEQRTPYCAEINGPSDFSLRRLKGDGDFRSQECIELLQQADIVVTNPPFSLFREYVAQLMRYEKKFLVIGNVNAITYKEIFPLIMQNKMWMGVSIHSGDRKFCVPENYPLRTSGCGIDEEGRRFIRVSGVRWFTNLEHGHRNEFMPLHAKYYDAPSKYPKYDNYDAINVDKTREIPCDYYGVMGVPITFLDKYCPEQFEIVAFRKGKDGKDLVCSANEERLDELRHPAANGKRAYVKKQEKYARILIRRRT